MKKYDIREIVKAEVARYRTEELQETDYTVTRLMNEENLTEDTARRILNNLTQKGALIKIKVRNPNGGGPRMAYRPVEKKNER